MTTAWTPKLIDRSTASKIRFVIQEINTLLVKEREHHVHIDPSNGCYTVVIGGTETVIGTRDIEEILGFLEGIRYAYGRLSLDYLESEGKMIDDIDRLLNKMSETVERGATQERAFLAKHIHKGKMIDDVDRMEQAARNWF
jgi:hypothetical protein